MRWPSAIAPTSRTIWTGLLAEGLDQATCMRKYTDVFGATLRNDNRMCLAGIMAAEHKELPEEVGRRSSSSAR
ncbi:MAG: hypothetical protein WDN31_04270 [Hyphomicrobium sp.]